MHSHLARNILVLVYWPIPVLPPPMSSAPVPNWEAELAAVNQVIMAMETDLYMAKEHRRRVLRCMRREDTDPHGCPPRVPADPAATRIR